MASKTITLVDNGDERYLIKADFTTLGRRYDNESEELTVIFPEFEREAEHACTMVVTHDNQNVDRILVTDNTPVAITSRLSQYTSVTIGFVFTDSNGYIKGSEKKQFPFLPAQSPEDFVPVDPEIEDDLLFVIANALTKLGLSGNTLQGKNKAETVTTSVDLTAFKNTNIKFNDQVVEEVDANDFAAGIKMSLDTTNYKLTVNLVDGNDVVLSTQTVDLPSENAIVDASYDETTKKITFVLQSGNTFDVDVSSIISGLIPDTRTIAGLRLNQNISASALRNALNVEDGASAFNENNVLAGTNISVSKSGKNVTISATNIPSVGAGTITIKQGDTVKGSFSVNQSNNQTIELEEGGGGGASSFDELTGSPYDNENLAEALNSKQDTISDLSTIRSGASAGATAVQPNANISVFTNDAGFITSSVNNLANYYLKSETYTQAEVNALIAAIKTIKAEIVAELPTADATTYFNDSKTIYMTAITGSGNDYYNEYITVRSGTEGSYTYAWEKIGNTQIDLSGYVQKTTMIAGVDLQDNITKSEMQTALDVVTKAGVETITGEKTIKTDDSSGKIKFGDTSSYHRELSIGINAQCDYYVGSTKVKTNWADYGSQISINENVVPWSNNTFDIGETNNKWKDLYLSGNLTDGTNSVSVAGAINKIESVSVGGTALTPDANKNVNIPIASNGTKGVVDVRAFFGNEVDAYGRLVTVKATDAEVTAKTNTYHPLTASNIDNAVKVGLTTNTNTLTDAEKATAQSWLGLSFGLLRWDE